MSKQVVHAPPAVVRAEQRLPPRAQKQAIDRWEEARRLAPLLVAILAVGIYATTRSDTFLTLGNFQNIFQQIAVLGILCIGAMLLLIGGKIDLSVGSAVSLVAVIGAKLLEGGASQPVTAVLMVALGAALGVAIATVVVITAVQPFILTLGFLSVFSALALVISNNASISTGLSFSSLSIDEVGPLPVPAIIYLGLAVLGALLLRLTVLGRRAYAMGANEEAAYLAGVPLRRTTIALYAINGALVGLAALMLVARVGSGDPAGGAGLELQAITAVVLGGATLTGGRGTMLGAFCGVLLLGVISNALQISGVSSSWAQFVYGGVLIVAVVWAALRERGLVLRLRRDRAPAGAEEPA